MSSGTVAGAGASKESVNYRQKEQCETCMHFYPPNSCETVAGNISREAVCNNWVIRPKDTGKDGSYYVEEFKKASGGAS
ncbi:hypothetical protein CCP3SC15_150013 [Gammaproteobacteria bacterium]